MVTDSWYRNAMLPPSLINYQTPLSYKPASAAWYHRLAGVIILLTCIRSVACLTCCCCGSAKHQTSASAPQDYDVARSVEKQTRHRALRTQSRFSLAPHSSPQRSQPFAAPAIPNPTQGRKAASSFEYMMATSKFCVHQTRLKICGVGCSPLSNTG
jgi:hypothetical protein